jgi:hypothetical protein
MRIPDNHTSTTASSQEEGQKKKNWDVDKPHHQRAKFCNQMNFDYIDSPKFLRMNSDNIAWNK